MAQPEEPNVVVGSPEEIKKGALDWFRQPISRWSFIIIFGLIGAIALHFGMADTVNTPCTKQFAATSNLSSIVNSLKPGDVACLASGDYAAVGVRTNWTASGTAQSPIVVEAAPGATVKLHGYNDIAANYLTVTGLIFDGPTGNVSSSNTPNGEEVLVWAQGSDITLDHVEVRNGLWHAGIYVTGDRVAVIASYVHDIGPWNDPTQQQSGGQANNIDHGIYWGGGSGGRVINTVLEHNLAYGIQVYPSPNGLLVANNTIVKNGTGGIIIASAASNSTIINNIIANNTGYDIYAYNLTGTGNVARYNLGYNNTAGSFNHLTNVAVSNNMVANPLFISAADYHLQSTSPAINAATSVNAPSTDRDGVGRPQGVAPDIGAYEFILSNQPAPPPPAPTPPPPSPAPPPPPPSPATLSFNLAANQTIKGSVSIQVTPANLKNISKVVFYIDNKAVHTEGTSPYCLAGDNGKVCYGYSTRKLSNGQHAFKATATYANGTISTSVTVKVAN